MRSQVQLGNEKKGVPAGFSQRLYKRDACATKDLTNENGTKKLPLH